jgi:cation:H+ antiporter
LVAFGTSFPELSISVIAAINKSDGLVIGNVVGSNIFNICGVLGIMALIRPIAFSKPLIKKDIPMGILTAVVLFVLLFDSILVDATEPNRLTRSDAVIFLLFFCVFLYYTFYSQINGKSEHQLELDLINEVKQPVSAKIHGYSLTKNIILIVLGLAAVLIGGELVVRGGVKVAEIFGMSQTLIGLTIVAIGTSLPELVTGIVAVVKGKEDLAIGNVVGSSVFNILFILGTAALISPIALSVNVLVDVLVMAAVTVFLLITTRSKGKISRIEGMTFIVVYVIYMIYAIYRG